MNRFCLLFSGVLVATLPQFVFAQFGGPAKVTTAEVRRLEGIATGRAFVGSIEARRRSAIGAAVSGRVVEFLVNEGDRVEAKQPLAKLLTKNLEIQIAAATAEHELRKQELLELKNGSREEEKRQALNRMKAAEASMRYAKAKLARTKELVGRGASTRDQLEDDSTAADLASENFLAAEATYDLVMAGPRKEKIAQAEARVGSAEEEINRLNDLLVKHTIVSPFAGYVVAEHTEVGQWIESGKLVAEVVEVDELEVRAQVLETYVSRIEKGMTARIEIDALPHEAFFGTVTAVVPRADEKSRSFPVKIALKNRMQDGEPLIKPGMFARVWLPVDRKSDVLVVPKDSIVLGGPTPMVFVVESGPTSDKDKTETTRARPVPVQLGIATESWIEVKGDLKPGSKVVVEGNERLRPGGEVIGSPAGLKEPIKAEPSKAATPKGKALPDRFIEKRDNSDEPDKSS